AWRIRSFRDAAHGRERKKPLVARWAAQRRENPMNAYRVFRVAIMALITSVCISSPSHAISGSIRVTIAKAGLVVGGGGGSGVLTYRHRNYPFRVRGLSLGITAGA